MFLLYINDTGDDIKSKFRLFADDSFLYLGIDCTDDCNQLQKDLDKLVNWASEWQMKFNASRCYKNSELDYFFFPPPKPEYFFSNIGNQNICLEKKP
jgi:hypothetical protein